MVAFFAKSRSTMTSCSPPWPRANTCGTPSTGGERLPPLATMRMRPARSVTSMRPSGRNAIAQGLARPLATVSTLRLSVGGPPDGRNGCWACSGNTLATNNSAAAAGRLGNFIGGSPRAAHGCATNRQLCTAREDSNTSVAVQKFALPGGLIGSELLNQSHTSKVLPARVPLNPKFAYALAARLCELRIRDTSCLSSKKNYRKTTNSHFPLRAACHEGRKPAHRQQQQTDQQRDGERCRIAVGTNAGNVGARNADRHGGGRDDRRQSERYGCDPFHPGNGAPARLRCLESAAFNKRPLTPGHFTLRESASSLV